MLTYHILQCWLLKFNWFFSVASDFKFFRPSFYLLVKVILLLIFE